MQAFRPQWYLLVCYSQYDIETFFFICITSPLWSEFTTYRRISFTKGQEIWCFLWCLPVYPVEQTVMLLVIWGPLRSLQATIIISMMTSSNGNIFHVTGPLWRGSTGGFPSQMPWHGALMFSLICAWTNGCANHRDHHAHYDVTVMIKCNFSGNVAIV